LDERAPLAITRYYGGLSRIAALQQGRAIIQAESALLRGRPMTADTVGAKDGLNVITKVDAARRRWGQLRQRPPDDEEETELSPRP
jgi:hypothetical protein